MMLLKASTVYNEPRDDNAMVDARIHNIVVHFQDHYKKISAE